MLPDRVSNPGPLTYESGALPIALRGPARVPGELYHFKSCNIKGLPHVCFILVLILISIFLR